MLDISQTTHLNGLDLNVIGGVVAAINENPANAAISFRVTTRWLGGTRSEAKPQPIVFAGENIPRKHVIAADEPSQIGGTDAAANPQELLIAAFNACIMVGYVAGAALKGIALDRVEIETEGSLDLRGFFGLSNDVPPGYQQLDYTVLVQGDGSAEDMEDIHRTVMATSPNYFNINRSIRLNGRLVQA